MKTVYENLFENLKPNVHSSYSEQLLHTIYIQIHEGIETEKRKGMRPGVAPIEQVQKQRSLPFLAIDQDRKRAGLAASFCRSLAARVLLTFCPTQPAAARWFRVVIVSFFFPRTAAARLF